MSTNPIVYEREEGLLLDRPGQDFFPSKAELEVMRLIASGHKDFAIARRLGVSVVTVRRRARSFRHRVGASNRPEAIAVAAARGWLSPTKESERTERK